MEKLGGDPIFSYSICNVDSLYCFRQAFGIASSAFILLIPFFLLSISQAAQVKVKWDPNIFAPDGYCIYSPTEGRVYDYRKSCVKGLGPYESKGRAKVVVLSKDGGCSTNADAIRYLKK